METIEYAIHDIVLRFHEFTIVQLQEVSDFRIKTIASFGLYRVSKMAGCNELDRFRLKLVDRYSFC